MNIYQILQIGDFHENYCEDFVVSTDIGQKRVLLSVLDGCTMGKESYFASALIGKIIRKISREEFYKEYVNKQSPSIEDQIKVVFKRIFEELNLLKNQLQLEREELLSTIILSIIDIEERIGEVVIIGDGLIVKNGKLMEYDQSNVPDYLGYHLKKDFEDWYNQQEQRLTLEEIEDISLSTDGIFTFSRFNQQEYQEKTIKQVIEYLLIDQTDKSNERMLLKKLVEIEKTWGLRPTDDIGIVRMILK